MDLRKTLTVTENRQEGTKQRKDKTLNPKRCEERVFSFGEGHRALESQIAGMTSSILGREPRVVFIVVFIRV